VSQEYEVLHTLHIRLGEGREKWQPLMIFVVSINDIWILHIQTAMHFLAMVNPHCIQK